MIILAGSLFGIQVGAIGTTYVKPYMVKVVMGVIMLTVLVSRLFVVPVYMADLGLIGSLGWAAPVLNKISYWIMVLALVLGAGIIGKALLTGMREHAREQALKAAVPAE
jgi:hypothetical protein